jgi:hypothetical protein
MRRVSASDVDELWVESKKVTSPILGLAGEGFGNNIPVALPLDLGGLSWI